MPQIVIERKPKNFSTCKCNKIFAIKKHGPFLLTNTDLHGCFNEHGETRTYTAALDRHSHRMELPLL